MDTEIASTSSDNTASTITFPPSDNETITTHDEWDEDNNDLERTNPSTYTMARSQTNNN
jgi:hypothetical protein